MAIGRMDPTVKADQTKVVSKDERPVVARQESKKAPASDSDLSQKYGERPAGEVISSPERNPLLSGLESRNTMFANLLVQQHGAVLTEVATLLGPARKNVALKDLKPHERKRLGQRRLSLRESNKLYRDVGRAALAMRIAWMATGNHQMAKVGLAMERLTRRRTEDKLTLLEARSLLDIITKLPKVSALQDSSISGPTALLDAPDDAMITEFYVSFEYDMISMRGPALEPAGFRLYFSTQAPTGDDAVDRAAAAKVIDVGVTDERLLHDPEPNTYDIHVAEVESDLDPAIEYHIWATAYNVKGESENSNVVNATLLAAQRGDLNKDGQIDVADVDTMLDILLDGRMPRVIADLNRDGDNTQADLDRLVDIINAS